MNGRLRNQRLSIGGFLRDGFEQQLRIGGDSNEWLVLNE
jgi:hypothetical protein